MLIEISLGIICILNFILICVLFNKFATCPITGVVDFKKNMYEYHFAPIMTTGGPMGGHVAWYTKKGYEERFACKIVQCKKQDKEWKAIPNKKNKVKGQKEHK